MSSVLGHGPVCFDAEKVFHRVSQFFRINDVSTTGVPDFPGLSPLISDSGSWLETPAAFVFQIKAFDLYNV